MITWPIYLALVMAIFAVRAVIKSEEEAEQEAEDESKTKNNHP